MNNINIGNNSHKMTLDMTRTKQTPANKLDFSNILKHGANVFLSSAKTVSNAVGIPLFSSTISNQSNGTINQQSQNNISEILNNEMNEELKLIYLQKQLQSQDRQISLISNVLKARHDTAKSAISNMRS